MPPVGHPTGGHAAIMRSDPSEPGRARIRSTGDYFPAETIAAIIADEMAIGVVNGKTTACRLVPIPGAKAGEIVDFGGLFGSMPVMEVRNAGASAEFVRHGGRIPAPIHSLRN